MLEMQLLRPVDNCSAVALYMDHLKLFRKGFLKPLYYVVVDELHVMYCIADPQYGSEKIVK